MKKFIAFVAAIVIIMPLIAGCNAKSENFDKQVDKMQAVLNEGEIYKDDYFIEYEYSENNVPKIVYTIKKDGEKIYFYQSTATEPTKVVWVGEQDDKIYFFYSLGDDSKTYQTILKEDINSKIVDKMGISADSKAKEILNSINTKTKETVNVCKDATKKAICNYEKNLLGNKVTMKAEHVSGIVKNVVEVVIKKGNVLSSKVTETSTNMIKTTEINIDYGNQKIKLPNITDFVKNNQKDDVTDPGVDNETTEDDVTNPGTDDDTSEDDVTNSDTDILNNKELFEYRVSLLKKFINNKSILEKDFYISVLNLVEENDKFVQKSKVEFKLDKVSINNLKYNSYLYTYKTENNIESIITNIEFDNGLLGGLFFHNINNDMKLYMTQSLTIDLDIDEIVENKADFVFSNSVQNYLNLLYNRLMVIKSFINSPQCQIEIDNNKNLKITFNIGEEYEIIIIDSQGRPILWEQEGISYSTEANFGYSDQTVEIPDNVEDYELQLN